ncbi:prolyl-tRNA synthetase [Candidatus Saccharibacteria bacterium]|nr:prolyl-tRNA synthetase [Candidatus Saccharibacteria bacterium]
MRRSQIFLRTRKEAPADEEAKNAQLLIRAGYIHKEMAGVYDYLPLGLITLGKIMDIIRQVMNEIGGQELFLSALQPKENWARSGRWHDDVIDVWFKTRTHGGQGFHMGPELGLSNTHEEAITAIMKNFVHSYKDLPVYAYQFQTKFRNEPRSKSGLLRCREFIMKDLYSFSRNDQEHQEFYEKVQAAYFKIFERLGLGKETYLTFASGGSFSQFSHEFQTITDVGEDTLLVHESKKLAINKEIYSGKVLKELQISKEELIEKKGVEVGNIFPLGTRFSEPLGLNYTDEAGKLRPVIMGCYGIGPGRVMGTIVEHFADDKGLVWPENVAPFRVYLARLGNSKTVVQAADEAYALLTQNAIGVLYDDRSVRPGEMFADADLLGLPKRVVISERTLQNSSFELKSRESDDTQLIKLDQLVQALGD